jgi:AmpD protein
MDMSLSLQDGWLQEARHCLSPNFNQRPSGAEVSLLVIHNISLPAGEYGKGYIEQLFCNQLDCRADPSFADLQGLQVSAHLLIERSGALTQFVDFNQRAWHAGHSSFQGCENCNDFSIGIELEGVDDKPYTNEQYAQLLVVTEVLLAYFPALSAERIVGHSDIAPDRKTDPGSAFDWQYYRQQLNDRLNSRLD